MCTAGKERRKIPVRCSAGLRKRSCRVVQGKASPSPDGSSAITKGARKVQQQAEKQTFDLAAAILLDVFGVHTLTLHLLDT